MRSSFKTTLKFSTALISAAAVFNAACLAPALAQTPSSPEPALTLAMQGNTVGAAQSRDPAAQTPLSLEQKIALLRQKVKYVFVIFQENRSFDHYFGTYPGANGLFSTFAGASPANPFSQPGNVLPSFKSVIQDTDGSFGTISPFLIPRQVKNVNGATVELYPESLYSVDHSHAGYINDFHLDAATKSRAMNDGYALDQEGLRYDSDASGPTAPIVTTKGVPPTSNPSLQTKQKAEVVMSHVDCDTVPFLWQYADRFVLFDNFHQTATGPSTPNAIAMIAGQVGDTQWVKHPEQAAQKPALALPNLTDTAPFPGSSADTAAVKPPYGPDESSSPLDPTGAFPSNPAAVQVPLTFATLPLSFMGKQINDIIKEDEHPDADLADIKSDIPVIAAKNPVVEWGWYQQGYGPEPFDGTQISQNGGAFHYPNAPVHASYIVHHNGPQYFGYLGDNPRALDHMHGLQQFFTDVGNKALPKSGGVFYVRGGYYNNDGLLPADPNPNVKAATPGNDDHPNYSDAQISEALVADTVNAIANSPYWAESATIITYDETDGLFDHQPEQFRTFGPDHLPETGGPRLPTIVISPFAAAHTVSHVYSEHASAIKFINQLYGLVPLADLPDEAAARAAGEKDAAFKAPSGAAQKDLGPADALPGMGDLTEAFDNDRLLGKVPPLPASYAIIPDAAIKKLPHYVSADAAGQTKFGCQELGISPTDYPGGYKAGGEIDPPPQDFNPRPVQSPGHPYLDTNNNTGGASTGPWPN